MEDSLFPELPEDLTALNDEELQALLDEHEAALSKIEADDPKYIGDMSAEEVLAQLEVGVEQIKSIRELQAARVEAEEAYQAKKAELAASARPAVELEAEGETDEVKAEEEEAGGEEEGDGNGEEEEEGDAGEEVSAVEEPVLVAAAEEKPEEKPAATQVTVRAPVYRRPPAPDADRTVASEENTNTPVLGAA